VQKRRLGTRQLVLRSFSERLFGLQSLQRLRAVFEGTLELPHDEVDEDRHHTGHAHDVDRARPRVEIGHGFRLTEDRHDCSGEHQAADHARAADEQGGNQDAESKEENRRGG
jgi:hypothetical protein